MSFVLNNGKSIPWLAFGTGTALYDRNCTEQVRLAIANGVKHLDGAQVYKNEDALGAGIAAAGKPRSELFVTTKAWRLREGQTVESTLRDSLKKLSMDYVDLYLIHTPESFEGRLKQVWKDMEEVQKKGLAKSIGVSNFTAEHLKEVIEVATVVPAVNQVSPTRWRTKPNFQPSLHRSSITPTCTRLLPRPSSSARSTISSSLLTVA
jgi:diketogulonate reductase-like aldo/keto reductase